METKLIIEGTWQCGKTTMLNALQKDYGYTIINEPNHLLLSNPPKKIDIWYIAEHEKNQNFFLNFQGNKKIAMERSILSSMAYFFACGKLQNNEKVMKIFNPLKAAFDKKEFNILYLYTKNNDIKKIEGIKDPNIAQKLTDHSFLEKYDFFYKKYLPEKYGIKPLYINNHSNIDPISCKKIFS